MSPRLDMLRAVALANGHKYHLLAVARIGTMLVWRTNLRGQCAERRLLRRLDGIQVSEVTVYRFRARGGFGRSKPCLECRLALQQAGVRWIQYTVPGTEELVRGHACLESAQEPASREARRALLRHRFRAP